MMMFLELMADNKTFLYWTTFIMVFIVVPRINNPENYRGKGENKITAMLILLTVCFLMLSIFTPSPELLTQWSSSKQ